MMKFNRHEVIRMPVSQRHEVSPPKPLAATEQKQKTVDEHTDTWQQNP